MNKDNNRAVFLDRDGVINRVVIRDGKPCSPRSVEEFKLEKGTIEAINRVKDCGYVVLIVTNQPDIARNKMKQETLDAITQSIYAATKVDDILICSHDDLDRCECRKPKSGMFLKAAEKWGINLKRSFIIGDTWKDMAAGKEAGCTTILLNKSYNKGVKCDFRIEKLDEVFPLIKDNLSE